MLLIVSSFFAGIVHIDYCKKRKDHLLCNPQKISKNCLEYERIPMTPKLRQHVLHVHNKIRNRAATGSDRAKFQKQFPTASNMLEMVI